MISILIIDDEPKIVNFMEKLIANLPVEDSLEIYKAYSALEAIDCLQTTKIHLVISDIKMPGMSGIELHQEIVRRWPLCKVIFLTGYNEFEYAQAALKNGAVDFLMKMDDNDTILASILNTIEMITMNNRKESIIQKGQEDLKKAMPLFKKELIASILNKELRMSEVTQEKFDEVQIPLKLNLPILPCICKVDEWKEHYSVRDKQLIHFAVDNIAAEILSEHAKILSFSEDNGKLIWIIQPTHSESSEQLLNQSIQPSLELVQEACKRLLDLNISLVITLDFIKWEQLSSRIEQLKMMLSSGTQLHGSLLIQLPNDTEDQEALTIEDDFLHYLKKLSIITDYLEEGNNQQFNEFYYKLRERILSLPLSLSKYKVQAYLALGLLFVSYLNKWNIYDKLKQSIDLSVLYTIGFDATDKEILDYFYALAIAIFESNASEEKEKSNIIVEQVNRYINKNLMNELSLNIIADSMSYNPSYLSRIYKHLTGIGISEYILAQRLSLAKSLLIETKLKIHEVAAKSGFISEAHFFRIFKKVSGMTPTEYRDLHMTH